MKSVIKKGYICVKDEYNIEYRVCLLTHIVNEDETFRYEFRPNYFVISLLDSSLFQGIPGLNLDLKKEVYIRENMTPCFISERVPQKNREDLYDLLKEVGLTYIDPIEYLCKTTNKYSGDNFYMTYYKDLENIIIDELDGKYNTPSIIKYVLNNLALGNKVSMKDGSDISSKEMFNFLYYLYKKMYKNLKLDQQEGIEKKKKEGAYKGRKPIEVSYVKMRECMDLVSQKKMTSKEASKILGISIDKYYREKKKILNNKN